MTGQIVLAPLIPWPIIAVLGAAALALVVFAAIRRGRGTAMRAVALAALVAALLNPKIAEERREPQNDVAVVVVDDSLSQSVGTRRAETEAAYGALAEALKRQPGIDLKTVRASAVRAGQAGGTQLFQALDQALIDVPADRLAGAFLITDGQVHDAPAAGAAAPAAPVHVLLTGQPGERDRMLSIVSAPGFGIVGQRVSVAFRVEDRPGDGRRDPIVVHASRDGGAEAPITVRPGQTATYEFTLDRAGASVLELRTEAAPGELSLLNNRAAVTVNAVRDRLRVLLISGQPHPGERTWRNLLKSDPAVDLVHFTILRPPEKDDLTPLRELALIVFPIQELFEIKLKDFNLVIFDRYVVRDILPPSYMRNIADYVRGGGALLLAVGPEFAGLRSLHRTPLGAVLPAEPTDRVIETGFRPAVTEIGRRHPVTAPLSVAQGDRPRWGRWFRLIDSTPRSGNVLMSGVEGLPLLVVDRVGDGRVAQFQSDHIWLWAREYEGGGPQQELLRRLAHWLMKEPELEEESLTAEAREGEITIARQSLAPAPVQATVIAPSGAETTLTLRPGGTGQVREVLPVSEIGLYRVREGGRTVPVAVGAVDPLEIADLRAVADLLQPVANRTGGGLAWYGADGVPELRSVRPGRDSAGRGWMGVRRNEAYTVTGLRQISLLPGLLVLSLITGGLAFAWWREGR